MKRCPACIKIFPDDKMLLCPYDGSPLFDTVVDQNVLADTLRTESDDTEQAVDPSLEKAAQLARKIEHRQKLSTLLSSEEGVRRADLEMQSMFSFMKDKVELINQTFPSLRIQFNENDKREATVSDSTHVVIVSWQLRYANTLSDSSLQIVERKRSWPYPQETDELNRLGFDLYMDDELRLCWKERNSNRQLTTEKLGQECLDRLLHLISTRELEDEDRGTTY